MEFSAVESSFVHINKIFYFAGVNSVAVFESIYKLTWSKRVSTFVVEVTLKGVLLTVSLTFSLIPFPVIDQVFLDKFTSSAKGWPCEFSQIVSADLLSSPVCYSLQINQMLSGHSTLLSRFNMLFPLFSLIFNVAEVKKAILWLQLSFLEFTLIVWSIFVDSDATAMRKAVKPLPLIVTAQVWQVVKRTMLNDRHDTLKTYMLGKCVL